MAANQQLWTKKKVQWKKLMPQFEGQTKSPEEVVATMKSFGRRHNATLAAKTRKPKPAKDK